MIKLSFFTLLFACSLFLLNAQDVVFSDFNKIEISGKMMVTFEHGNMPGFSIEETNSKEDYLVSESENTLKIGLSPKGRGNNDLKHIKIYYADLSDIILMNEASGSFNDSLQTLNLHVRLQRNSTLKLKAMVKETMTAEVLDKSSLNVMGRGNKLVLDVKNQSRAGLQDFKTDEAIVNTENNGRAEVFATDKIKATTSNGGTISYLGSPAEAIENKTISGGNIVKL
ncbi:MAG: DUF2807 domain-containing protein [Saprospiraceae bacterium]|nr:DUF2807 domain-containing protein [Saprospiraceae bacterium]